MIYIHIFFRDCNIISNRDKTTDSGSTITQHLTFIRSIRFYFRNNIISITLTNITIIIIIIIAIITTISKTIDGHFFYIIHSNIFDTKSAVERMAIYGIEKENVRASFYFTR